MLQFKEWINRECLLCFSSTLEWALTLLPSVSQRHQRSESFLGWTWSTRCQQSLAKRNRQRYSLLQLSFVGVLVHRSVQSLLWKKRDSFHFCRHCFHYLFGIWFRSNLVWTVYRQIVAWIRYRWVDWESEICFVSNFVSLIFLSTSLGPKSATTPVYASECAPAAIRGGLVMQWWVWTERRAQEEMLTRRIFFRPLIPPLLSSF